MATDIDQPAAVAPRDEIVLAGVRPPEPRDDERRAARVRWIWILLTLVALGSGVAFLLTETSEDAFVYSKLVHQVMRHRDQFVGREIRVEGELTSGSVRFRRDPCEWRFELHKNGQTMPVRFPQCIVPDTFRDNMGITVTVQGALGRDGTFMANQVVPRCPSKYEMDQRKNRGEATPHPPASASRFPTGT